MNSRDIVPDGMNPVSRKLIKARYIVNLSWMALFAIAAGVAGYFLHWSFYIIAGVFVALIFWLLWLIPSQVKLMGWQETDDELLITKGRLWHRFTVVPYGRIQFVDVSSGPIARMYGLKAVKLHTASAGTDATVKGLEADTADALRERLADKARERMSGL